MVWQQWVLLTYIVGQMIRLAYMADRPRQTQDVRHVLVGLVEFGVLLVLVATI